MSGGKPSTSLHIGVEYKFNLVARATNRRDGSDFAVYERRNGNGGAVDYIIARVPPAVSFHENPGNQGKRLAEIPKDYLVWSLDDFNGLWPQTREAIESYLEAEE